MVSVLFRHSHTPSVASTHTQEARTLSPRRGLPNGRAVVGGFLVAAGAIGVFSAYQGASQANMHAYVTARNDLEAGELVTRSDLVTIELNLPKALRQLAVTSPEALIGSTTLAPVSRGQLIWRGGVVKPDGSPQLAQISIPVQPANALGGRLLPGERVDVLLASTASGTPEVTTISSGARVVRIESGNQTVGSNGALTLVLAVPQGELEEIAKATASGTVTIARVTGLGWNDNETSTSQSNEANENPSKP